MVLHSPPRVIDTKGETSRGETSIEALIFLDWAQDYSEWWATQSCGPLGGLVEAQVSFIFLRTFIYFTLILLFKIFDNL